MHYRRVGGPFSGLWVLVAELHVEGPLTALVCCGLRAKEIHSQFRKELSCELTFDTLSRIIEWRSERPDGWQVPDYIEEKVENTSERPLSG